MFDLPVHFDRQYCVVLVIMEGPIIDFPQVLEVSFDGESKF